MIDISIIIVNWNTKEYLRQCLQSIRDNVHDVSYETIVVDNGSEDGSPEMLEEHFPWVTLIETGANLGFAKANNIGMKAAGGRYYCLSNSDIVVKPGSIELLVEFMDSNEDVGIAGPRILNSDDSFKPSCRRAPSEISQFARAVWLDTVFPKLGSHMTASEHQHMRDVDVIVGCFWIARREAVDEIGMLDERFFIYSEDNDWCRRFNSSGWRVVYNPETTIIHIGGVSSSNDPITFYIAMMKSNIQYWQKHYGSFRTKLLVLSMLVHHALRIGVWEIMRIFFVSKRPESSYNIKRNSTLIKWLIANHSAIGKSN